MSTPATVPMLLNGQLGDVPQERMRDAINGGAKLAVPMIKDGAKSYIPHDQVGNAQKAGFQVDHPIAESSDYGFNVGNLASQGWEGIKQLAGGLYGTGKDVLFPEGDTEGQKLKFLANKYLFQPAEEEQQKARTAQTPWESVGHSIASALPIVGPWAASLGEQAGTGDIGGAGAKAASQMLALKAAPKIGGVGRNLLTEEGRTALSQAVRNPVTGRVMTPWEMAVNKVLPDPYAPQATPAKAIPKGTNYGQYLEAQKAAAKPTPDPVLQAVREGRAAKLPTRMPKQLAPPPPPFLQGATPSNVPIGNAPLPSGIPQGTPTPFPEVVPKAQVQTPSSVLRVPEPNEALPPINPNYMASVPRGQLLGMAKSRTPGAATQLQQLGNKVIYTPPEGYPGPRPPSDVVLPWDRQVPQATPQLRPAVQEMAQPSGAAKVPEWRAGQTDFEIARLKNVLRNPQATPEETAIAKSQLANYSEEPVEAKIKGITAEEPKTPRAKREVLPPIEKRFSPEEIADAEGLLASEAGAMSTGERPGRYFDESVEGEHVLTGNQRLGIDRAGGSWRGVKSGREMFPFMREHPEMNPEAVLKALRNKDSAFYKRAMEAAIEFIRRGNEKAKSQGVPF